ncbi:MAG: hypothetical protein A3H93_17455 [Rhodocyclales bacterium RIFCSPLOWO2_02_FULL_63_24]|nr:MAG: hypothetical protein A2040_17015 [Rhodocyclales bacterium GWA2_65_19]OHC68729.1 MAG: hypothetical protein A3H93_17455 [Rhodocyclales bacterium RIFCSPLOWO2_02_FULL_63_24]
MNRPSVFVLAACGVLASFSASAADADLQALREEIAQMKKAYEQRIDALEQRLVQAENTSARVEAKATRVATAVGRPAEAKASAFNPEVSLILQGALTKMQREPANWTLQGFVPGGEPDEVGPPRRKGLSLRESELVLSANVDPNFRGYLNLALSAENTIAVEEAYFNTLGLGSGLTLKGGRFLSGIGYQNEQHPHSWDFADAPLAYSAFFGNKLTAEGLQLKWLAPTETWLELGLEAGRDSAFPGSDRNKNGSALGAVFARTGADLGISSSWRAGLSAVGTRPSNRGFAQTDTTGNANTVAFSGNSRTVGADFVWKWAPNGNPGERNFKFQAEAFRRVEQGDLSCADAADPAAGGRCFPRLSGTYSATQNGLYAQAVYQFMPRWRVGYRYDRLDSGNTAIGLIASGALTAADLPQFAAWKPRRDTVMIDYASSEFARLRFQFARDASRGPGLADNQFWLQYVMSIGAHGAHKF